MEKKETNVNPWMIASIILIIAVCIVIFSMYTQQQEIKESYSWLAGYQNGTLQGQLKLTEYINSKGEVPVISQDGKSINFVKIQDLCRGG